jgi:hypothetical protein
MQHTDYTVRQLRLSDKRGWALDDHNVLSTFPFPLWDAARAAERKGHSLVAMRIRVEEGKAPSVLVHCVYVPSACWAGVTFWGRKPEWMRAPSREEAVGQAVAYLSSARRQEPEAVAV